MNTAANLASDLQRVFDLQTANQWNFKASTAAVRKAKLTKLREAVGVHADGIVAAVQKDTRKPEAEIRITEVGGVTVNGVFSRYLESQLPFGGVNTSGIGSYHGVFGFKAFSHERAVYLHSA